MPATNSLSLSTSGSSRISGNLSAVTNQSGAGSRATVTATSPTGESISRTAEAFSADATSSSAQVNASVFPNEPPKAFTTATVPARILIQGTDKSDFLIGSSRDEELQGMGGNDLLFGDRGTDRLTGGGGSDLFVITIETNDPLLADVITDFNAVEGDRIILGGLTAGRLSLEAFDSDGNGSFDATLIKLETSNSQSILGRVLGTVDEMGNTTLSSANFAIVRSFNSSVFAGEF